MRLQNYLTQPFAVAEVFTGMKGEYVPLEQTLTDCERILAGDYDKVPAEDIYMKGSLSTL